MKRILALVFCLAFRTTFSQQPFYNVSWGNGNGIRFWEADSYKIHMGIGAEYFYGPVTGYSIKTNMTSDAGRGWVWGVQGQTPIAALDNTGQMRIAGMFEAGGQAMALRLRSGNSFNDFSKTQVNFSYDGGTGYSHSIRTRHQSAANAGNAIDFYVWQLGDASQDQGSKHVMSLDGGNVGIGTSSPQISLEVVGSGQIIRNGNSGGYTTLRLYNNQNQALRALEIDYAGSSYSGALINNGPTGESGSITTTGAYPLILGTSNTARMVISGTGNIGIGTSTPSTKLSLGTNLGSRMVSLYDATTDWYGLGMGSYQMRLQVGTANARFSFFAGDNSEVMTVKGSGNVGIGTTSPDQKLTVKGKVHAEEVIIDLAVPAPDYVFEKSYDLKSLDEVKKYIDENKHLPEVPSAKEMEKDGVKVGEMEMILLKKVEELTLYVIELKKQNENQQREIEALKSKN